MIVQFSSPHFVNLYEDAEIHYYRKRHRNMLTNKIAQFGQLGFVIFHGVGEVHEVVKVHRVVFCLTEFNGHSHWFVCKTVYCS